MHYIHWGFEYAFFQDHLTSLMIYRVYSCLVWGNYSRKSTTRFLYKMSIKNGGNLTTFEYGFQSWMKIDFKPNPFITLHRKWRRGSVKTYQPHFRGGGSRVKKFGNIILRIKHTSPQRWPTFWTVRRWRGGHARRPFSPPKMTPKIKMETKCYNIDFTATNSCLCPPLTLHLKLSLGANR